MELGLAGKVAIVTGASRGLGAATARELAREGMRVVLVARSADALRELAEELSAAGAPALAHVADLRVAGAAESVVEAALERFGQLDLLVNNAGATKRGDFLTQLTDEDFHDGFALKFHGYVRLTRAAWPALKSTGGAVVNIIGIGGRRGSADFTIGGSVNAALFNFTQGMAQVGVRDGVRVNAINPGSIETGRLTTRLTVLAEEQGISETEARAQSLAGLGAARFGQPEEIGRAVAFLASRASDYMQGALVDVDGGAR